MTQDKPNPYPIIVASTVLAVCTTVPLLLMKLIWGGKGR